MIEILVTSSVLILALLLLRLAGSKVSARLRYALWALVLVRLLLPGGLLPSNVSVMNAVEPMERLSVGRGIPDAPRADPAPPVADPGPAFSYVATQPEAASPEQNPAPVVPAAPVGPSLTLATALTWLWLAGICVMGGYFVLSNLLFYRRLRRAAEPCPEVDSPLTVYQADFLPSPCLAGLLRPAIYLNAAALTSGEGLRHVLAHELCHKKHGDNWWALLRCVALAIWWFNPLVWLAAWLSRRDCELACDESALILLGEGERIPYGRTLVKLTTRPAPADLLRASTAMTAGKGALKERVRHLAKLSKMSRGLLCVVLALAVTAGVCTFTGAMAAEPRVNTNVGNYFIPVPGQNTYQWNYDLERDDQGWLPVPKETWDTTLKDVDPSLVTVSYPTADETKNLMRNISYSWAVAFAQQFYHLAPGNPALSDKVSVRHAGDFYSTPKTASGGAKIINSTTVNVQIALNPVGSMEKAAERVGGEVWSKGHNGEKSNYVQAMYLVTLTRTVKPGGTTEWRCTNLDSWYEAQENTKSLGNYTPTALPITVAPKEGWYLSELDSAVIALPDLGWNDYNQADRREMEIRAAMAFGQEYYALKPGHPYRAEEVRILPGTRRNLTVAVKPVGGIEAVEGYFKGSCPKGVGELEGFVLQEYSFSAEKQVIESFGDKPVYTITAGQMITLGPARFDASSDLSTLTDEEREVYDSPSARPHWTITAEGTGKAAWQNAVEQFATSYAGDVKEPLNNQIPGGAYFDLQILDAKLTGWSEGGERQIISGSVTYAFLPTWGANAAMTFHKGQCTLGTGALEGYVIRTIPVFYLENTKGNDWACAGVCTLGDGKSVESRWLSTEMLNRNVTPITAPPAGVNWVTAN